MKQYQPFWTLQKNNLILNTDKQKYLDVLDTMIENNHNMTTEMVPLESFSINTFSVHHEKLLSNNPSSLSEKEKLAKHLPSIFVGKSTLIFHTLLLIS